MRPPLVLEVFEQHPTIGPLAYRSDGAFMPYTLLATEKKFSDAELAAEYWFMEAVNADMRAAGARGDAKPSDVLEANADLETIERFATLPHIEDTE